MEVDNSIRTSIDTTEKIFQNSLHFYDLEGLTVQKVFHENAKKYFSKKHYGFRQYDEAAKKFGEYKYFTYGEFEKIVDYFGSGLRTLGFNPKDKIGIMAKNCIEWGISDYASACHSLILVPVYDSYLPPDCEFIISHSEMRGLITSKEHLDFISKIKSSAVSNLEFIIVIDNNVGGPDIRTTSVPPGATHLFSQIIQLGRDNHVDEIIAGPDDISTFVYTSGTTGIPKAAMLSQLNIATGAVMLTCMGRPDVVNEEKQEVCLSYLPLAHIFGRELDLTISMWGGRLPYFTGTIANLVSDMVAAKGTVFAGVPRVFIKTYQKIRQTIVAQPFYKRWVFSSGFNYARSCMRKGTKPPAWVENVVFKQIRASLGGCIRYVYNGGSTLPFNVREFLSVCLGTYVGEGYGLSETSACITCVQPLAFDPDTVGIPYLHSQIRLKSLPEMDYFITDKPHPRGEILVKGPQIFKGYFKDEDSTFRSLDAEGWFHTGDVGALVPGPWVRDDYVTPRPSLRIIDRKKNIFKLAQGEFVCAERVEAVLVAGTDFVKQVIVYGPQTASALVAIIVPEWDALLDRSKAAQTGSEKWGGDVLSRYWESGTLPTLQDDEAGGESSSSSSSSSSSATPGVPEQKAGELITPLVLRRYLLSIPDVALALREFFLKECRRVCESIENREKIKRFEIPRGVVLCVEEWTDQNSLMTPSNKIKREAIRNHYNTAILMELERLEKEAAGKGKREESAE